MVVPACCPVCHSEANRTLGINAIEWSCGRSIRFENGEVLSPCPYAEYIAFELKEFVIDLADNGTGFSLPEKAGFTVYENVRSYIEDIENSVKVRAEEVLNRAFNAEEEEEDDIPESEGDDPN